MLICWIFIELFVFILNPTVYSLWSRLESFRYSHYEVQETTLNFENDSPFRAFFMHLKIFKMISLCPKHLLGDKSTRKSWLSEYSGECQLQLPSDEHIGEFPHIYFSWLLNGWYIWELQVTGDKYTRVKTYRWWLHWGANTHLCIHHRVVFPHVFYQLPVVNTWRSWWCPQAIKT